MNKGKIRKNIESAIKTLDGEIGSFASGGHIAAGLSSEGYNGGYRQALYDVIQVLNGIQPNTRGFWDNWMD